MNRSLRKSSYEKMQSAKGFTLVEALVVLVIAGILIAFGVPQFELVIKNNRVVTTTNEIVGMINFARVEALRTGNTIHFGPHPDTEYEWVVWVDTGDDVFQSGEELRVWAARPEGVSIGRVPAAAFNTFQSTGSPFFGTTYEICDDRNGETGNRIVMLASGSINRIEFVCG